MAVLTIRRCMSVFWCVLLWFGVHSQTSRRWWKPPVNKGCKCPNSEVWEVEVPVDIIAITGREYSYNCYQEALRNCRALSIGLAEQVDDLGSISPYYVRDCKTTNDQQSELREFNVSFDGVCRPESGLVNVSINVWPATQSTKTPSCRTNCFFYIPRLHVYDPGELRMTYTFNNASKPSLTLQNGSSLDLRSRTSANPSTLELICELTQCAGAPSTFDWKINGRSIAVDEFPGVIRSSTTQCTSKMYGDGRDKFVKAVSSPSASIVQMDVNRLPLHPLCATRALDGLSTRTFELKCSHYLVINSTTLLSTSVAVNLLCPTHVPTIPTTTLTVVTQASDSTEAPSFLQKNMVAICICAGISFIVLISIIVAIHRRCCRSSDSMDDATTLKQADRSVDGHKHNHKNARVTFANVEVLDSSSPSIAIEHAYRPPGSSSDSYYMNNNNNHHGSNGYYKVPVITSV